MTAGLNLGVRVWHWVQMPDDAVGGSNPTGTVLYSHRHARLQATSPTSQFLEQGLETVTVYTMLIDDGDLQIQGYDEIEIMTSQYKPEIGLKYRVRGEPVRTLPGQQRGYLLLTLTRSEQAHARQ